MVRLIRCRGVLFGIAIWAAACKSEGVVEVHPVPNSMTPPDAGSSSDDAPPDEDVAECPAGWNCMDLAGNGFAATDGDGKVVKASCSMGLTPKPCDEADPAGSCEGLSKPFCAHLSLGGQTFVSCAQRCTP